MEFGNLFEWIINNKEWIFSGVGVTVTIAIVTLIFKRRDKYKKTEVSVRQKNNGDSTVQIGIAINQIKGKEYERKDNNRSE